ncbi:MAG: bifunctional fructose-bisphosphatase/inositol-phosphate phosphatase [Methanotrichaceae archaeon]|nr:bifunctional fructose-bisphosphatase/inositol-phosphate phosphatase [Methanotrichaceae archaeon]
MSNLSPMGCQLKKVCDSIAVAVSKAIETMIGQPSSGIIVGIGADGTPTKSIDSVAENVVFSQLRRSGLGFKVLSEERGEVLIGDKQDYFLYLDPLDGTYNAIKGLPFYSVSIYMSKEKYGLGYVFDLARGIKYYAEKGGGAYVEDNGSKKIGVSSTSVLKELSISAYTIRPNTSRIVSLGDKVRRIRTLGSMSLEMALVASGMLDAFVDLRGMLRLVDAAAGKLILEEAGGVVTDLSGKELHLNEDMWLKTDLIGSNGILHREILKLIGGDGN